VCAPVPRPVPHISPYLPTSPHISPCLECAAPCAPELIRPLRQVHDLWHVLYGLPPTFTGEVRGDMARCGEIKVPCHLRGRGTGRYGEIWGDMGRSRCLPTFAGEAPAPQTLPVRTHGQVEIAHPRRTGPCALKMPCQLLPVSRVEMRGLPRPLPRHLCVVWRVPLSFPSPSCKGACHALPATPPPPPASDARHQWGDMGRYIERRPTPVPPRWLSSGSKRRRRGCRCAQPAPLRAACA